MTGSADRAGAAAAPRPQSTWLVAGLFAAAFVLRLAFSFVSEFWGEDQLQIYLIGLKFFTTGAWPYFGPDVVYTETHVPGALQGLLVGGPFWIAGAPESPYVLLSLLSFGAFALLGWYISRRVPDIPRWFLWPWMFFSPWTLDFSTQIVNPSYAIIGAVPFFVAAFEIVPALAIGVLSPGLAGFALGFGLLWVYQLHLSASLLAPLAVAAVLTAMRADWRRGSRVLGGAVAGALVAGSTLVPTLLDLGVRTVAGSTGANLTFVPSNLLRLPQVIAQFLSFACYEIARFLGPDTHARLAFLVRYWWAAPFIVFAAVCGVAQTVVLAMSLFGRSGEAPDERATRIATIGLVALLYVSFLFSVRAPASHAFYVLLPVVVIDAFYVWARLLRLRAVRIAAVLLLGAGGVTQVAIAVNNFTDRSVYTNRTAVVRAIRKNFHLVGERRSDAWPDAPLSPRGR